MMVKIFGNLVLRPAPKKKTYSCPDDERAIQMHYFPDDPSDVQIRLGNNTSVNFSSEFSQTIYLLNKYWTFLPHLLIQYEGVIIELQIEESYILVMSTICKSQWICE